MSLVIALAGSREAVIGADRRVISFLGACPVLEEQLYSGRIRNDEDLKARAGELRASLQVSDDREKIWRHGGVGGVDSDVLVGEVAEISPRLERRRRIYLAPGAYLIVEIRGGEAEITGRGNTGCTVFGNRFTQRLAGEAVARAGGRVSEDLIRAILTKAGEMTASVSREHMVLKSDTLRGAARPHGADNANDAGAALLAALQEDCRKSGWRLCGQQ